MGQFWPKCPSIVGQSCVNTRSTCKPGQPPVTSAGAAAATGPDAQHVADAAPLDGQPAPDGQSAPQPAAAAQPPHGHPEAAAAAATGHMFVNSGTTTAES